MTNVLNENAENPVRLGLVGLSWGERVARAVSSAPGAVLAACFARTPAVREEFASRHGCRACNSYEAMLADASLDGIVIMTPNGTHRELAVAALQAGRHVLVTKPIATTLADAALMIAAATAGNRILAVGHQSRRQPAVRMLKALLEDGTLGEAVVIEGNTSSPTGLTLAADAWRASAVDCPGGPLLQLGIHYVDNFQYLLGPVRRVSGWQGAGRVVGGACDTTVTRLEFSGGAVGTLVNSYIAPSTRWMRLAGTKAVAAFDALHGLTLQHADSTIDTVLPVVPSAGVIHATLTEEISEFAHCVRTGLAPEIDGVQGRLNLAVVLAAVESHRRNSPVDVEELLRAAE